MREKGKRGKPTDLPPARTEKHLGGPGGFSFSMLLEILPETLCPVLFHEAFHLSGAIYPVWKVGRETVSPHPTPFNR